MSEAELHVLRARLRGGILSKARRGELETPLPIGFRYDANNRVVLDPDKQVQQTLRTFFQTFRRTGSATGTVRAFREQGLKFPRRARTGPAKDEIIWGELAHSRALWVLHNPRFAGAFFFGRSRQRHSAGQGGRFERLPRDQWTALLPNAHAGYISWDEFEENQRRLRENSQAQGPTGRRARRVKGRASAGVGDLRRVRRSHDRPLQRPQRETLAHLCLSAKGIEHAEPLCQTIPGNTSMMRSGVSSSSRSPRWLSKPRSPSSSNCNRELTKPIACARIRWSEPATRSIWLDGVS